MAKVDYLQEQATDPTLQRIQMNTARALQSVQNNAAPTAQLIAEVGSDGQVKSYDAQEYEIYHALGKEADAISIASSNGLVQIYSVTDSNPQSLDRAMFTRIKVVPLKINGVAIETDTTGRQIRFWVS
jgi:hypothetical protein